MPGDRRRWHAWVTGATGFLGRCVARQLAAGGYSVVGFVRQQQNSAECGAPWDFTSIEAGSFQAALFEQACERSGVPSLVFHAVGSGSVGQAEADPAADFERTCATTERLIGALDVLAPAARLIYPSSAAVYGAVGPGSISEDTPTRPISVYGKNKLLAEDVCRRASHKLDVVIARFFSVYGPPQRKLLLWELGNCLIAGERVVELGGTGEETRDFIHVADAAKAVAAVAGAERPPNVVNVGAGRATSIRMLVSKYARALQADAEFRFSGQPRAGDPPNQQADISSLAALGLGAFMPLEEGLADYARWLKSVHEAGCIGRRRTTSE